jgi:hypothetical protein
MMRVLRFPMLALLAQVDKSQPTFCCACPNALCVCTLCVCAASEARAAAEEAAVLAASAQGAADERSAELRVVQDSLKGMREECNERWVSHAHVIFICC